MAFFQFGEALQGFFDPALAAKLAHGKQLIGDSGQRAHDHYGLPVKPARYDPANASNALGTFN
jgi:hypothetical protein